MPNNFTDISENRALDWLLVVGSPTRPSAPLRIVLYTTLPNVDTGAGGVEVTTVGTAYVRQTVVFTAASGGASANTANILFAVATANYGTVVGLGVIDNAGVLLLIGSLTASRNITTGKQFKIPAGALAAALD